MISKGARLVLASQIFAVIVHGLAKTLASTGAIDVAQILQGRMFVTLSVNSAVLLARHPNELPLGTKSLRGLLLLRTFGGICGSAGFYYSITYLPLADATTLNLLAPLGTSFVASFLASKRLGPTALGAAITSLVGAGLITKPQFIVDMLHGGRESAYPSSGSSYAAAETQKGVAFSMLGVCGGICSYTAIAQIGGRAHPLVPTNCFAAGALLATTAWLAAAPAAGFNFRLAPTQWLLLALIGLAAAVMEYFLTAGMASARDDGSGGHGAVYMMYSQVVLALAADWLVWRVAPDLASCAGCALVVLALFLVARPEDAATGRERWGGDDGVDV